MMTLDSALFAGSGDRTRTKLVLLGVGVSRLAGYQAFLRSLNFIEHVSPRSLMGVEISRPRALSLVSHDQQIATLRRWYWTRKPDAGFLLLDFPATLLQALVFDEWVEARNERVDAVIGSTVSESCPEVHEHYQKLGILQMPKLIPATP
ncbi:MAG: adenylate kinase [Opitutaceae bacterium]|nr:adenylate kinase [Opitutaceae bacterium]